MKPDTPLRGWSLLILLVVTLSLPLANSTYYFIGNTGTVASDASFATNLVWELLSIGFLALILRKQGRSFKDIGFQWRNKDVLHAVLVYAACYAVLLVANWLAPRLLEAEPNNIEMLQTRITLLYVLYMIINPFFEELIVRGYVITELSYLFKKEELAVLVSTLLQTSYHLYQGVLPALSLGLIFFVFSIYFAKTRRLIPVIVVHLVFDVTAMLNYGQW